MCAAHNYGEGKTRMWKLPPLWMRLIIGLVIALWGLQPLYLGTEALIAKKSKHLSLGNDASWRGSAGSHGWEAVAAGLIGVLLSVFILTVACSVIFFPSIYSRLGLWREDRTQDSNGPNNTSRPY